MNEPRKQKRKFDPKCSGSALGHAGSPRAGAEFEVEQVRGGDLHQPSEFGPLDVLHLAESADSVADELVDVHVDVVSHGQTLASGYRRVKSSDIDATIGRRVAEERARAKVSQRALAEAMGIAAPHLSNLEKGLRGWTCVQMVHAAAALHVNPADLIAERVDLSPEEAAVVRALRTGDAATILAAASAAISRRTT